MPDQDPIVASYPSKSRPDLAHAVQYSLLTGEVYCTCESYVFSKHRPKHCKHIIQAIQEGKLRAKIVRRPVVVSVDWLQAPPAVAQVQAPAKPIPQELKPQRKNRLGRYKFRKSRL